MSDPAPYTLDQAAGVSEQVRAIAAYAKSIGRIQTFERTLRQVRQRLQYDPNEWGDPNIARRPCKQPFGVVSSARSWFDLPSTTKPGLLCC
jgi:hypothetical protein